MDGELGELSQAPVDRSTELGKELLSQRSRERSQDTAPYLNNLISCHHWGGNSLVVNYQIN